MTYSILILTLLVFVRSQIYSQLLQAIIIYKIGFEEFVIFVLKNNNIIYVHGSTYDKR